MPVMPSQTTSTDGDRALPAAARLGGLLPARELAGQCRFTDAWRATCAAIVERPFHPEAWILLARIAAAQGHHETALACARRACELAPKWEAAAWVLKEELENGVPLRVPSSSPPLEMPELSVLPRLSVCLITRNEERHLTRCLNSIFDLAHEIIVVDTGSTDATVGIARSFGVRVRCVPWADDFSAARNEALLDARGDWILMLDADEELDEASRDQLTNELRQAEVLGYRLPILDVGGVKEDRNFVPRLFRNAPGLFYSGRVHEQIFPRVAALARQWGLVQMPAGSVLLHHGYAPDEMRRRDKIARNLRLIERALTETPGDAQLLMQHGLELARSGRQPEALDQYRRAADELARGGVGEVSPEFRETLLMQFTAQLLAAGRLAGVASLLHEPWIGENNLSASLSFVLGIACLKLGQPAEAAKHFQRTLARRNDPAIGPVHPDIHTVAPHHCLAMSLAAAGVVTAADSAFQAALQAAPDTHPVWMDYCRFLAGHGRETDAVRLCCQIAAKRPDDTAPWELGAAIMMRFPALGGFAREWIEEAGTRFPAHAGFRQMRLAVAPGV